MEKKQAAIEVEGLAKRYGEVVALEDVSFAVPAGFPDGNCAFGNSLCYSCRNRTRSDEQGHARRKASRT